MNKIRILVLCALVAICSCKKKTKDNNGVSFNNHLDKQITLTVYPSAADYANGTNVVVRKTIKARDILVLQEGLLVSGRTYYMDWFTDDFYTNNWFNDVFPIAHTSVAFKPGPGNNSYYFDAEFSGFSRKVFLADNDLSSNWHAVNAYMYSNATGYVSFWSKMTENERYHQIKVTKGFVAEYNHKNGVGNIITDALDFRVQRTEDAYIEFLDPAGKTLGSMATGMLPTGIPPDYKSTAKDTVLAFLPNSDYYFTMVRD